MRMRTGQFCRIRLELARQVGHPTGDQARGYELVLPLNSDGRIDATSWLDDQTCCTVRKFQPGEPDRRGVLARSPNGRWHFQFDHEKARAPYDGLAEDRFVERGLIGVVEDDDRLRTYRVAAIEPMSATVHA